MSNPTSDNKETKSRAKGPSLRIETAGDISEERLARVAAKFAEVNEIEEYRLIIEQRDDLIGGFIVYFQGKPLRLFHQGTAWPYRFVHEADQIL